MKNLSIRVRLILAMAAMATLMAIGGGAAMVGLGRSNEQMQEMYTNRMASAMAMQESMINLLRARTALDRVVLDPKAADSAATLERADDFARRSDAAFKHYLALPSDAEELALSGPVEKARAAYFAEGQRALVQALNDGREQDARAIMMQRMAPLFTQLSKVSDKLNEFQEQRSGALYQASQAAYQRFVWATSLGMAFALVLVAVVSMLLTRAIVRPIETALEHMQEIGAGNLTGTIRVQSSDEMGRMLRGLERMQASLIDTVGAVLEGSQAIAAGSRDIAGGNAALSQRTETQASALEETAAAMEELTTTVQQNAEHATHAAQLARDANAVTDSGSALVRQVVGVMEELNTASRRIETITALIESIAFQTNILALNAAVESARAGEHGRGFAVVAAEVRMLAQRCTSAAKEIGSVVGGAVQTTRNGNALAHEASTSMASILDNIGAVSRLVSEISAASQEQATGIEQVNQAIMQMDEVTQQNAALVEESLAATEALSNQAGELQAVVERFTLTRPAQVRQPARRPVPALGRLTAA